MSKLTMISSISNKLLKNIFMCILATKARTLKEEWIAYVAREVLRVSFLYTNLELIYVCFSGTKPSS